MSVNCIVKIIFSGVDRKKVFVYIYNLELLFMVDYELKWVGLSKSYFSFIMYSILIKFISRVILKTFVIALL